MVREAVRFGHSNVQGDRTVGIIERPAELFLKNLDACFGIDSESMVIM